LSKVILGIITKTSSLKLKPFIPKIYEDIFQSKELMPMIQQFFGQK